MKRKDINDLLGSDMAQRDPRFLEYCIYRHDYLDELNHAGDGLLILNAPRGSGKSGLFIQLKEQLSARHGLCVISKSSGNVEYPDQALKIPACVNFWKNQLLGWIFSEIGSRTKFAFTEAEINAVSYSESIGTKEKNTISTILDRLRFKGMPFEKTLVDPIVREEEIIRLLANKDCQYWLILDELDDNYDNTPRTNTLLAGLLLAAQAITEHIPNVRIRVTIRPHIMRILETGFDKIPTLRESQISVRWTSQELKSLLARRIESYVSRKSIPAEGISLLHDEVSSDHWDQEDILISFFFDNLDASFRDLGRKKPWIHQTLSTISMYRPRWFVEFCKLCLAQAEKGRVTERSARLALFDFGKNRIAFLEAEHSPVISNVAQILNQFAANRKTNLGDTNQLRDFIKHEIIHTRIVASDESGIDRKALEIARFLHMIDFIQARETLSRGAYKHHYFFDRPQILSSWDTNQGIKWIIHPSFSNALDLDENRVYRAGDDLRVAKPKHQQTKVKGRRNRKQAGRK